MPGESSPPSSWAPGSSAARSVSTGAVAHRFTGTRSRRRFWSSWESWKLGSGDCRRRCAPCGFIPANWSASRPTPIIARAASNPSPHNFRSRQRLSGSPGAFAAANTGLAALPPRSRPDTPAGDSSRGRFPPPVPREDNGPRSPPSLIAARTGRPGRCSLQGSRPTHARGHAPPPAAIVGESFAPPRFGGSSGPGRARPHGPPGARPA